MSMVPRERKKQSDAYLRFAELKLSGHPDPWKQVGIEFKVAPKTIRNWSSLYKWADRYEIAEQKAIEEAHKELATVMKKQDVRMRMKVMEQMNRIENAIIGTSKTGDFTVKDYETFVKLHLLLNGEATERVDNQSKVEMSVEQKREMIENLSRNITEGIYALSDDIDGEEIEDEVTQ